MTKPAATDTTKDLRCAETGIAESMRKGPFLVENMPTSATVRSTKQVQSSRNSRRKQQVPPNCLFGISPRLLDVEGAAVYLSLSTWSIRDLIGCGKIPVVKIPHPWKVGKHMDRVLIDVRELDAFIDALKPQAVKHA